MEPQASVDVWVLNTLQCMLLFDFEHKKNDRHKPIVCVYIVSIDRYISDFSATDPVDIKLIKHLLRIKRSF